MSDFVRSRLSLDELEKGILECDRIVLGKAITLIESSRPEDIENSALLLDKLMPKTGESLRVGITGVPGVGKSTFIEALGEHITQQNKKLAVLSIDPSSSRTKGSILGDKTRMEALSHNPMAFIRPSPAREALGGVASKTRETILLCEAAGYDIIIVETVGVGQSETAVKDMVDAFLLLMLSGGGDELQGIKRGIMEMADIIAINKVDGDNISRSKLTRKTLENAVHFFPPHDMGWEVPVALCSALKHEGIHEIWTIINQFHQTSISSEYFRVNRERQNVQWFEQLIDQGMRSVYLSSELKQQRLAQLKNEVSNNKMGVRLAIKEFFKFS